MKAIICLVAIIGVAVAYPQYEGAQYTNEAIQQARNTHLIPQNAQIDSVSDQKCREILFKRKKTINFPFSK